MPTLEAGGRSASFQAAKFRTPAPLLCRAHRRTPIAGRRPRRRQRPVQRGREPRHRRARRVRCAARPVAPRSNAPTSSSAASAADHHDPLRDRPGEDQARRHVCDGTSARGRLPKTGRQPGMQPWNDEQDGRDRRRRPRPAPSSPSAHAAPGHLTARA